MRQRRHFVLLWGLWHDWNILVACLSRKSRRLTFISGHRLLTLGPCNPCPMQYRRVVRVLPRAFVPMGQHTAGRRMVTCLGAARHGRAQLNAPLVTMHRSLRVSAPGGMQLFTHSLTPAAWPTYLFMCDVLAHLITRFATRVHVQCTRFGVGICLVGVNTVALVCNTLALCCQHARRALRSKIIRVALTTCPFPYPSRLPMLHCSQRLVRSRSTCRNSLNR